MPTRQRRFLVGSVSSLVWPAITVFMPLGITFAAARVYAESAPPPENCDAGVVLECADAAIGSVCHSCAGGTCACFGGLCKSGDTTPYGNTCRPAVTCVSYPDDPACQGKKVGDVCLRQETSGVCETTPLSCLPDDGGPLVTVNRMTCGSRPASDPDGSPSSSGSSGGSTSGTYIPGPDKVPGSSGATPASSSDDSGCTTTSSSTSTLPLFAAPVAIGLLFALRRKRARRS